ncbi:MAG: hypothetical protein ACYCW6_30070 [Candidatus Xenobia bacterium]
MRIFLRNAAVLAADLELACWMGDHRTMLAQAQRLKRSLDLLGARDAAARVAFLEQATDPTVLEQLAARISADVAALEAAAVLK